jgi:signal transduction histidine kinase
LGDRKSQEADPAGGSSGQPVTPESENARLREEIAFLQKKLQLVGSVTRHDVLNQLTAVLGYNELMAMMVEDPKVRSFLEKERQAIDKIRRQFQFAKDYQNLATEPPRWQHLNNTVSRVREEFDVTVIRITCECGDAAVFADPLLGRALSNLFDNTFRYGSGATEIRITLRREGPGAVMTVEDNGAGIPAGEKVKIFERGYGKGTGWGLFLVREILAVTGMTIEENGEPQKGARFEIRIPEGMFRKDGGDLQTAA